MSERQNYTFEIVTGEEQIIRISKIFERNGNNKSINHLKWQYQDSPAGTAITAFAVSPEGEDAAVYSVFPVRARVGGQDTLIAQSLDTLTDAEHRGKGLFSKLAGEVFKFLAENGFKRVYGFPNSNSAPGFFGKLGWRELGYPPFVVNLSNLTFPLHRLVGIRLPRIENIWQIYRTRSQSSRFTSRNNIKFSYDNLISDKDLNWACNDFLSEFTDGVTRDPAYLVWRYSRPDANYTFCCAWEKDRLKGFIAFRATDKHGGKIGYIMDIIVNPNNEALAKELIRRAVLRLYIERVDVILGWSEQNSKLGNAFRSAGFFDLNRRLQPIKLFFGIKDFQESPDLTPETKMFLSYADSDTV